jgi:hypothetical protein
MLTIGTLNAHRAVWLENAHLKVGVLPRKGADIVEFCYKPAGVEFLMKTPAGLRPPGASPPADFLENYEGGWQELFPNPGDACEYRDRQGNLRQLPFHGEAALLPWQETVERDDETGTAVRFAVHCQIAPFRLERLLRLPAEAGRLEITCTVANESERPQKFLWGQHLVLGSGFIEDGCSLEIPARTILTPASPYEPATARLAPGQRENWPWARGRTPGEWVDLRRIPGPQAHSHDDAFLTGLEAGRLAVTNPRLGLRFRLEWDAAVFGCLTCWQPFGGAELPPLAGIYGLGIEPWVSHLSLEQALAQGAALELPARGQISTWLCASTELL